MANAGQFKPGQSGNPRGRPPKARALANQLEQLLKRKGADGRTGKQAFAEAVISGLTRGYIEFPTSTEQYEKPVRIGLTGQEYISLSRIVLAHLDGPAPTNVDLTSGGKPLNVLFEIQEGSAEDDALTEPDDSAED